jgi:RNA polymerase sigma-70 factor (ECF subfamily)
MDPERAILDAFQKGDRRLAASLVVRHFGGVLLGLALVLVGPADAPDVVQETLLALLDALDEKRFKGKSTLRAYTIKTLRRQAAHVRDSFWHKLMRNAAAPEDEEELVAPPPDSERPWTSQEAGELLARLLGLLDARSRVVISMQLEGQSFASIGKAVGISEGNARLIHHRALQRLHLLILEDPRAAAIVRGEAPQKPRHR